MTIFDVVVFLILLFFVVRGLYSGMVAQIVSVGSYVVCWVVSSRFSFLLAPSIPAESPWDNIGAMIILFVATMIAIRFLHSMIRSLIEKFRLAKYDRLLGAILGFAKGLLICMVITFFAVMICEKSRSIVFESKVGNTIANLIVQVKLFLPDESCKMLRTQIDLFDEQLDGKNKDQDTEQPQSSANSLSTIFGSVQNLRDQIEDKLEKSKEAVSLLDGIFKWWNREDSNDTNNTDSYLPNNTTQPQPHTDQIQNQESQITTQPNAPTLNPFIEQMQLEPVPKTAQNAIDQDITEPEQLSIPHRRNLFRLSRSPALPAEFNKSNYPTQNNSPARLFGH
ncbi:MAG: CvpA family protein [Planctomycetaceae bacterium]|jgi:membrane protein required for colicin V production|nr:CvpA family protein [Planctomycetaceae bacterium]